MKRRLLFLFPILFIVFLISSDLFTDYTEHRTWLHIILEALITLLFLAWFYPTWRRKYGVEQKNSSLLNALNQTNKTLQEWKNETNLLIKNFEQKIQNQFEYWNFSQAEKEIALLLLKGHALKEIASLRKVSEKTVRQQASGIYAKSALSGRAELSAHFMASLLKPQ